MRKIAIVILSLFFFFAAAGATMRSPWGKGKIIAFLTDALRSSGVTVEIGDVTGNLPHQAEFKQVVIHAGNFQVKIQTLDLSLSLWRLLKREIAFSNVSADHIRWEKVTEEAGIGSQAVNIPYTLYAERFKFTDVSVPEYFNMNFEGAFQIAKKGRRAFFDATARRTAFPDASLRMLLTAEQDGSFSAKLNLTAKELRSLPLLDLPFEGAISAEGFARGTWNGAVEGKGSGLLNLEGNPDPWAFSGTFSRKEDFSWAIRKFNVGNDWLRASGSGALDEKGRLISAQAQLQTDRLEVEAVSGKLFANIDIQSENGGWAGKLAWRVPKLGIRELSIESFQGTAEGAYLNGILAGSLQASGDYLAERWEGTTPFSWEKGAPVRFSNYQIGTGSLSMRGDLALRPDRILMGTTEFTGSQWHVLSDSLYGSGTGTIEWYPVGGAQGAHFDAKMSDFYWNSFSAEQISIYSDLIHPFGSLRGIADIQLEKGRWNTLYLESASLETSSESENWPFKLFIDGEWKHPLSLQLDGYWRLQKSDLLISLQGAAGSFFNHPILLDAPVTFEWTPDLLRLTDFSLHVADATLLANINHQGSNTEAHLLIDQMPLDFLSLNPLDVNVGGKFSLNALLNEAKGRLQGSFTSTLQEVQIASRGETTPLEASGSFKGSFSRDLLDVQGEMAVQGEPLLNMNLSLPVHIEAWPFASKLFYDEKAHGKLIFNGHLEDILDFFDLGTHRLEGICRCDLSFHNTLSRPILNGTCFLENGSYQNYFTGTELQDIHARWTADFNTLKLSSFKATDIAKMGTLTATGKINMTPADRFPFHFDIAFKDFTLAAFDLANTQADGKITLSGTTREAFAKGNVLVLESDIAIPSSLPRKLPELHVVYKNKIAIAKPPQPTLRSHYPIHLDLNIDAPDAIFIAGRGLSTEWKGNFHLSGTQTAPISEGKIELMKGTFSLAGKQFKLKEGTLSFSGMENEIPYLSLAADIDVKDISITARITGPLNNPQVTLQSSPPLPMGTIMSYLLFGQNLAEINSFQALQIAESLSTIAGEGPSVLESTRKALGVDRIQIINVPSASDPGGQTIAVQVGKYVSEEVLVSFSQGAEDSSTNISIEVEFKGGLSFVLESQQPQEQGKFTLKWAKTY